MSLTSILTNKIALLSFASLLYPHCNYVPNCLFFILQSCSVNPNVILASRFLAKNIVWEEKLLFKTIRTEVCEQVTEKIDDRKR
jgi:hypothetical protein